ncbi:metal-sensing transcriptional repressor [bacterium]|nr:metal-sensing transcriptional repressor [bacterium]
MGNTPELNHEDHQPHVHDHNHDRGYHKHIHSQKEKKAVINRLSKAAGHIEAIKRMVANDADCSEVLIQLAAVRAAINNTGNLVLKNHINHCIVEAVKEGEDQTIQDLNNAIDRFLK